jgi:hypothetical protein
MEATPDNQFLEETILKDINLENTELIRTGLRDLSDFDKSFDTSIEESISIGDESKNPYTFYYNYYNF